MTEIIRPFADPTPESVRAFIDSIPLYRDDDDPTFWPRERLESRQDELLCRQLGWLTDASPHYQRVFKEEGVDVERVRGTADLVHLPVTTKADLMGDPPSFRLHFTDASIYDMTYTTVYTTGTTTGRPTPYEYTSHDFFGTLLAARRGYKCSYIAPGDAFLTTFPLSPLPHVAGMASLQLSAVGVTFQHGLSGTPYPEFPVHRPAQALADTIEAVRPQILAGVGSFLRRMFVDAGDDGRNFSSLRVVLAAGETLTRRMREHMHENLARVGAPDVYIASNYGFTEGGLMWAPCAEDGPMHAVAPDQIFTEVLDPQTHQRLPDGETGVLAITHLNRRGMPLLRYLLGDITAMTHERCDRCGRQTDSLLISSGSAHVSRTSELLKIKGTLVNPQVIHDLVMNTAGVMEYQFVVANHIEGDPLSADQLVLRIGLNPAVDPRGWDSEAVRNAVFNATEVRPVIELVDDLSAIYDPSRELKARRIIDARLPVD